MNDKKIAIIKKGIRKGLARGFISTVIISITFLLIMVGFYNSVLVAIALLLIILGGFGAYLQESEAEK